MKSMKTIKYVGMLVTALFLGIQVMNAQAPDQQGRGPKGKRMSIEQMTEMRCSRIIKELGLDDKTAARFTEVYKKYMEELQAVRKEFAGDFHKKRGEKPQPPTDEEVDKMMRDRFAASRKTLDIREKYYDEFRKFLTPKQVAKVYDQGQQDRGKFQQEMNRRKGMKRPDGPRGPQGHPEGKD